METIQIKRSLQCLLSVPVRQNSSDTNKTNHPGLWGQLPRGADWSPLDRVLGMWPVTALILGRTSCWAAVWSHSKYYRPERARCGMYFTSVYTAGAQIFISGCSVPVEQHCQVQYGMDYDLGMPVALHCCKKSPGSWFRQKYLLCRKLQYHNTIVIENPVQ